jgi:dipeptide/tripeptide permease
VLVDMVVVLKSPRFVLFLLVMVGALGPFGIPVGSLFVVATVALIALGELFAQARVFEYIGALAPKGQEGLFLGYANLPTALGALTGGPVGAYLFHDVITSTRLRCGACYGKGAASLSRDLVALDYALEL